MNDKELIENLRSVGRLWEDDAADLIERLTTENQNLLLANRDCVDHFNVMKDDLAAAQKRIESLEASIYGLYELENERDKLRWALENCRLFAARHRKEDWALRILIFCDEVGAGGSITR